MKEKIEKWIRKNGACSVDFKNKDIIFYNGGLFSIEKKSIMLPKIIGYKKLKNGFTEIKFSKEKYKSEDYKATLSILELDETINYLRRLKYILNKNYYNTGVKNGRKNNNIKS